jgi:hypothetical protein
VTLHGHYFNQAFMHEEKLHPSVFRNWVSDAPSTEQHLLKMWHRNKSCLPLQRIWMKLVNQKCLQGSIAAAVRIGNGRGFRDIPSPLFQLPQLRLFTGTSSPSHHFDTGDI